jgi:glycosyltransferase involved in cell wall biosynthesis
MTGLSIIIPVYNEEDIIIENAVRLIEFLDRLNEPHEILICSNGSTDSTIEKGESLQTRFPDKVKFLSVEKRGVGLAFKKAIRSSSFPNNISIDMDLSTDLDFIPRCFELLKEYDIVVGSKKVGSQRRSLMRKFISNFYIFLVRIFLGLDFSDYSIGAKGYKKNKILRYLDRMDHGSSYVVEIIFLLKGNGGRIKEIPVFCQDTRKSKFNLFNEIIYRFKNLLIFLFRERIL